MSHRQFSVILGLLGALSLAIRLTYVLAFHQEAPLNGDGDWYHGAANALADGHGYADPFGLPEHTPSAIHPPAWTTLLAGASYLGLRSLTAHQLVACVIGASTVVVIGLAGRAIANARVGLLAAFIAAIYPNFWAHDAFVLSETLVLCLSAVVVFVAYLFSSRPTLSRAIMLGGASGLLALTRAEAILIALLVITPLTLFRFHLPRRQRFQLFGAAAAATVVVVAPWISFNMTRFQKPALLSTGLGPILVAANCATAYGGEKLGYYGSFYECFPRKGPSQRKFDESSSDVFWRGKAVEYARNHTSKLPVVLTARLGRTWGFFRPAQQLRFDSTQGLPGKGEAREAIVSWFGLGMYYALVPSAVVGGVLLRRRGTPIFPLVALVLVVSAATLLTFGQTRYRAMAEVALVLLAAVALETGWAWLRARRPGAPLSGEVRSVEKRVKADVGSL
jgi:hypothetical protein